jgi:hypothetical protein
MNTIANFWKTIKRSPWKWGIGGLILLVMLSFGCFLIFMSSSGGAMYEVAEAPASRAVVGGEADGATNQIIEPELTLVDASTSIEDILSNATFQAQEQTRVIIYTGEISLVVQDTDEAVAKISEVAAEMGGYVSGSNIFQSNDVPRGSLTLRVPAERYQETLIALRALALRVERETSATQDVTEEFTDLQARKSNLEFTEAALQDLLEERERVGSTSDILEVYRELTTIRGQLEQIEGRLRYLTNQAALSTITVTLTPDVLYQPIQVGGWQPQGVAREALQSLLLALQGVANVVIWLVVFTLPLLIVVFIPLLLLIRFVRSIWRRYKARGKQTELAGEAS